MDWRSDVLNGWNWVGSRRLSRIKSVNICGGGFAGGAIKKHGKAYRIDACPEVTNYLPYEAEFKLVEIDILARSFEKEVEAQVPFRIIIARSRGAQPGKRRTGNASTHHGHQVFWDHSQEFSSTMNVCNGVDF